MIADSCGRRARQSVRVTARLDAPLSRWLWLVKWILIIPHCVVLFFLWIAFGVVTVIAFFAILFTERYPRPLFDFNLGVLRWSWRAAYSSYGALATDRHPRFTLGEEPDYPARLDIAYPGRLSRGLVVVKWWLLAIPQYVVIGFFVGGWHLGWWTGGLVDVLTLIAAVVLAFTVKAPARPVRPGHRTEPMGTARRGLRHPDDGRLSAVPSRHGRRRTRRPPVAAMTF